MEEDIEKALNNLWNSLDDEFFNLTYSQEQMQEDIRLILNRYNYLDLKNEKLINKYKELLKIHENFSNYSKSVFNDYADMNVELQEKDKIIELMSEELAELNYEYCGKWCKCKKCKEYYENHFINEESCNGNKLSCIIDYFKKKARDGND